MKNFLLFAYQLFVAFGASLLTCVVVHIWIYPLDGNVKLAHFIFFGLHYILLEHALNQGRKNNATSKI